MRFTDSKKRAPLGLIGLGIVLVVGIVLILSFCTFQPTPRSVQKTITFEVD